MCARCPIGIRKLATTSSDKTARIWDVDADFELKHTLEGHTAWVWDCAFSADSSLLVTGEFAGWVGSSCVSGFGDPIALYLLRELLLCPKTDHLLAHIVTRLIR